MPDNYKISLDEPPHSIEPFNVNDYSAKIVLGCIYEPLFFKSSTGIYHSNMVTYEVKDNKIIFSTKKFFWSNGELLTALDIKNTLLYIIMNKTPFFNYLFFIHGVEDYIENGDMNNIGIHVINNETLQIDTLYEYDFMNLFSTIQFAPIYIRQGKYISDVTNGPYQMPNNWNNHKITLHRNNFYKYSDYINKTLIFIINNNMYSVLDDYFKGDIDMTCSTAFPFEYIEKLNYSEDFYIKKSNIEFNILINNNKLLPIKNNLSVFIFNKLKKNNLLNKGLFIRNNNNKYNNISLPKNKKPIKIAFPDYYPNEYIVEFIIEFLENLGYETKIYPYLLSDFLQLNQDRFDITLNLFNPLNNDELEYYLTYINFFHDNKEDEFIRLLNDVINNNNKNFELLDEYIQLYSSRMPFGFVNHIYLKNNKLLNYQLDNNDLFSFRKVNNYE